MSLLPSSPKHRQRAAGAFFGRRIAKPLKASQAKLFADLLPALKINLDNPLPKEISGVFNHNPKKIILEIGFGGGEHLIQRAVENSGYGFIGAEPFINGMGKALSAIDRGQLSNIRLFDNDATRLLDWLPPASIDDLYLLYPDPWPKKRHWKRRFANADNLKKFARILKPGGIFYFASDIPHYVNWTLNLCHQNPDFNWMATQKTDWDRSWPLWKSTRYELKALREGRVPAYLTFKKSTN